jgi:polyisoprenoid-binding protein YceI
MLKLLLVAIGFIMTSVTAAQGRFFTKTGDISFYSKTKLEDIEAHNRSVTCVLDTKTGNIQFAALMKGFEFKKALMQEHFNENYVESDKYPKAEFKGQVANNSSIDYANPGVYPAKVKGQLTIHGQTKDVETDGTITVKDGKLFTTSEFQVAIADYKISVPALVKDNISKVITVKVSCTLESLK